MKFVNYSNFEAPNAGKVSKSSLVKALLEHETKNRKKVESLVEGLDNFVNLNEAISLFTDKLKAISVLNLVEADKKPGPDGYMTGLDDETEEDKKEQMKKQAEMDDDDPDAYKEMPGDKEAREKGKVKTSKHTKAYDKLYGDDKEKNEARINISKEDMEKLHKDGKVEVDGHEIEFVGEGINENYEVIYSDGVSAMKKFRTEQQALDFMHKEIKSNKKLRDIAVYKPGMHSTTQTELVVAFWGDRSYLDNVSKKDPELAAKKVEESTELSWDSLIEKINEMDINEWGGSDQYAMNQSIHRSMGKPKRMPSPFDKKLRSVAADAVDFYWDDWPEYKKDYEGLVDDAVRSYLRAMFPKDWNIMVRMFEPVDEALCEATVEMDALDPDNKDFLKFLKKHRVKIINKEMDGPGGNVPVITMQGKRKDLEKVLADEEYGWADPDLAEYIEESVVNEGLHPKLKKAQQAIKKGETVYGENVRFPGRFKILELGNMFAKVDYEDGTEPMEMASMNIKIDSLQFESVVTEAGMNDPVLMAFRAAKMKREKELAKPKRKPLYGKQRQKAEDQLWDISQELKELYAERGQLLIDMEQEAEVEGGNIADEYGTNLNVIEIDIQNLIAKRNKLEIRLAESFEVNEADDYSDEMSFGQLERCIDYSTMIRERIQTGTSLDPWMHSQIAVAENELNSVFDALDGDDGVVEAITNVKAGDLVAHDKTGERFKVVSIPSKTKIIGKNRKGEEKTLSKHHVTMVEVETNEAKKLDRDEMMAWLEGHLDFVRTTEEFDGTQGGIWTSGESGDMYKGKRIFDYYNENYKKYEFGVYIPFAKEMEKRGWYGEWYDAGTMMIWPI